MILICFVWLITIITKENIILKDIRKVEINLVYKNAGKNVERKLLVEDIDVTEIIYLDNSLVV